MLTAAIASSDLASSAQLLASLEQTGKVKSVRQWAVPTDHMPDPNEGMPDVVFLDLARNPEPFLEFAAQLRRNWPAVRVVACSSNMPPNPQLLLSDAERSPGLHFKTSGRHHSTGPGATNRKGYSRQGTGIQ